MRGTHKHGSHFTARAGLAQLVQCVGRYLREGALGSQRCHVCCCAAIVLRCLVPTSRAQTKTIYNISLLIALMRETDLR